MERQNEKICTKNNREEQTDTQKDWLQEDREEWKFCYDDYLGGSVN
jgi:hypothetical protein